MIKTIRATAQAFRMAVLAALIGVAAPVALAQAPPPGAAPPPQMDLNAMLVSLAQDSQAVEVAKACSWSDPLYREAAQAMIALRTADLRARVPADKQPVIDATLANGNAAVAGFACKTADGKSPDQRGKIELFVIDQYWRMIARVDVLGGYRWGEPFRFTPEERDVLDKEIKHIREFKGYGYWSVGNPLETYADETATLACRERSTRQNRCKPVPPELESSAPAVKTMIEVTEGFGKTVAASLIREKQAFAVAVGDITQFRTIGDAACEPDALAVKFGEAQIRSVVREGTYGGSTDEVIFVEKFRLGTPERIGWVLFYHQVPVGLPAGNYIVLAEDGGEWDEESARNGAGQVRQLSDALMDDIESRDLPMELEKTAIMDAKATVVETYFNNFVSMGLMQSIGGNGGVPLTQCPAL
jgi:hypothetical protein